MGAVKGRWALSVPIITTNIRQLVQFTRRKPSQEDLQRSVLFLAEQIPARVVKFSQRLASPQFASTPASRRLLGVCGDLVSTVYAARNEHVQGGHSDATRAALHASLAAIPRTLTDEFQPLKTGVYLWLKADTGAAPSHSRLGSDILADAYAVAMATQLLLSHYMHAYNEAAGVQDRAFDPYLAADVDVLALVRDTAEDAQALSIEKNGNAPEFAFTGDQTGEAVTALCPEAILHFCLMEVMKNAVTALVNHRGRAYDLDFAPPIHASVARQADKIVVRVVDEAGGMPADVAARACDFFYTSVVEEEPNYYTSMNFGAAIAGYGFGLPLAQLNVRQFLGGGLAIHSTPGRGTAVEITLCPTGDAAAF